MLASRSFLQRSSIRLLLILLVFLTACESAGITGEETPSSSTAAGNKQTTYAEITFEVQLPEKLADGQNLYIEFLDEVTGLALNPSRAQMQTNDQEYFGIKIPVVLGSVVKYRYFRDNDPIGVEYTADNNPVRYRLYVVYGPGVVQDTIAAWRSAPSSAPRGRIEGQVANKKDNSPIVNALVAAGGVHALTASDGSFVLEGLSPGLHNLVAYALDGSFQPFQQGAQVAAESTTPALILANPVKMVNVTFNVHPPAGSPNGIPIRLVGNTYALGNTFADLAGGINTLASRAPLLNVNQDGAYSITMQLPVGLDLRYKYTLGDGFWNAEHGTDGMMRLRQLIVPGKSTVVEDTIESWKDGEHAPITFTVTVPADTPTGDVVSIQFNPYGWTQPIPMWPVGQNRWFYALYSPFNSFGQASYRYCRNEQCGVADASNSAGPDAEGFLITPSDTVQNIEDTIPSWAWENSAASQVVISGAPIQTRNGSFQAGVAFAPSYTPSVQAYSSGAVQTLKDIGANTAVLTPTWHLTNNTPPVMAPVTGQDALWLDLSSMITKAQNAGISMVIHPILRYNTDPDDWWQSAARDDGWWQTWFARYTTFLLYHADLATQTGAKALIIGDETVLPALPGGKLADGSLSNVPGDAEERWSKIIAAIRSRYSGKLIWMIPYHGALPEVPAVAKSVDYLYVEVTPPLMDKDDPVQAEIEASVTALLDGDILKLQEESKLPVILGLQYPSVRGAFDGCVSAADGGCLPMETFLSPGLNIASVEQGLEDQAYAYSAFLSAIDQRSWIAGFYSAGYYLPVEVKDFSTSVRGKPAGDVLGYWYPRLTGQVSQ